MVDGTFLMRDREFTRMDEVAIIARSERWMANFEAWYRHRKGSGQPRNRQEVPRLRKALDLSRRAWDVG